MEKYFFDVVTNTLTISARFNQALRDHNSEEYELLMALRADFPSLKIVRHTHQSPKSYKTKSGEKFSHNPLKGLTFEKMEKFIDSIPDNEKIKDEYKRARQFAEAADVKTKAYSFISKWFIAQFPEYRKNPLFYINDTPECIGFEEFVKNEPVPLESVA